MEPALKQRVIGAVVLIALAVIFLPMLIKGPAPESGASNIPLELPKAPEGDFETRELPLVSPGQAPQGGAVGMQAGGDSQSLPTVDTTTQPAAPAAPTDEAYPAAAAGGDYAVSFGSYATTGDADRVVKALQAAQLPGYQEPAPASGGRTLHRVRIGPFATQAEAEAARLQSARVRSDVGAKVVTLEADAAAPAPAAASQPAPAQTASVSAPVPLAESRPAAASTTPLPAEPARAPVAKPAAEKPVEKPPAKPAAAPTQVATRTAPTAPAASGTGFAVQLGAFGSAAEAGKLRDRARSAGFSAFVEQVRTDKGTLNRVRVGPVASRSEADQLKAQVAAKLGVSGIVRPHP